MRKLLIIAILALGFGCAAPIMAQDAPKAEAAPVEAPKAEEPKSEAPEAKSEKKDEAPKEGDEASAAASWIEGNFHIIVAGLLSILAALGILGKVKSWIKGKVGLKNDKLFEFVEISVNEVYNEYVKDLKSEGKLTNDMASKARGKAIAKIKAKASEDGLKIVSEALLPVLIEKAINGIRRRG